MTEMRFTSEITVRYIDHMGDDARIAGAAWVSTSAEDALRKSQEEPGKVAGLINYLMEHRHGTPFEAGCLQVCVHAPIFVWREWHRHRVGFCLAGDTQIWADRYDPKNGRCLRKLPLANLCRRWNYGVEDCLGRIRHLASVKNQTLRVLNEETHLFEMGGIEDVFQSGIKEVYQLQTRDHRGFGLRCSKDHQVLTPDGWAKVGELSSKDCVYVSGKRNANEVSVPPSLRRGIGVWTSMQRNKLIRPVDCCYVCSGKFSRDVLILDHKIPVAADLLKALDKNNLFPICPKCHRLKSNNEQKLSDRNIVAGSKLVRLTGKPVRVSEEMTYDIAMKGPWHNFVANGIVVHNSYNEESGRYKQLDPVFYIPPRDRPMVKVDGWKPGRPKFLYCESEADYETIYLNLKHAYHIAYSAYEVNLALGIDPGLARDCLPVGIYSSCWVTMNPRSLMHFLSLRTHEPTAAKVSYPLYEIEVAARQLEALFALHWPITQTAWVKHGRVAP